MFKTHGVALHPGIGHSRGMFFLFAHGPCELQWDHTRACATDFLAHNTCGTRACCASTKTTRFGLTTHPWVRYHLSFLQVHCHMIPHPFQSNGNTKQTKFCCFRGPHASMCHTSIWLCTQLREIGHLCSFHKGRQGAHWNEPTGQNRKWPTSGQGGYITPAARGIPTALERGAESEVAHKWARWLHNPCRLGDPHRFKAGSKIRSGPQMGKLATSPLPPRGSPPLQSGGQNQKWPTSGQGGYITPAAWGNPTASERGLESEVSKKVRHPCIMGGP